MESTVINNIENKQQKVDKTINYCCVRTSKHQRKLNNMFVITEDPRNAQPIQKIAMAARYQMSCNPKLCFLFSDKLSNSK